MMSALLSALALTHTLGGGCPNPATPFAGGVASDTLCSATAVQAGLTVVDLRDGWAPYPLAGAPLDAGLEVPEYAGTFVDLASGRFDATPEGALAESDRYLELYGVPPTPSRVLAAMSDEARHTCHDALDPAGATSLAALEGTMRHERRADAKTRRMELRRARARVKASMRRLGVDTRVELRAKGERYAGLVDALEQAEAADGAIRALQGRLRCDGLLHAAARDGDFDWATRQALATFQRRHALVSSGVLDATTRDYLQLSSRELDYRLALRLLRARVADAAGLIADGSAIGEQGAVFGRLLDEPALRYPNADEPLEGGVGDTLSPATEAAAEALGWTSFEATRDWLKRHVLETEGGQLVAVALPERPAHLKSGTRLRVEIDGGGANRRGPGERRPQLTLSAEVDGAWTPLVRWPTTVGGWQDERQESGRVRRTYKASEYGPRHWRQLVVAPVWYPPQSTPHDDLVGLVNGQRQVKEALIGPSYRSAYGLVMLVHDRELEGAGENGEPSWYDAGIRTHGSANYRSIIRGSSHGCHRLYNVHVLRLANYLLKTQEHEAKGALDEEHLRRSFRYRGQSWTISRDERGFAYEFAEPIPVDVREGA